MVWDINSPTVLIFALAAKKLDRQWTRIRANFFIGVCWRPFAVLNLLDAFVAPWELHFNLQELPEKIYDFPAKAAIS